MNALLRLGSDIFIPKPPSTSRKRAIAVEPASSAASLISSTLMSILQKQKKLIVKLGIRITSRELERGLAERQRGQQQEDHVTTGTGQLGRGMRARRAPKRLQ